MLLIENQLHFLSLPLSVPLFQLRGMGREKSTEEGLKGCKPLDGPCFSPWYTTGSCSAACRRNREPCRRCSRRMGIIRALQCASYFWRQKSPSGATAGGKNEDSPRTTFTHVTSIPRNTKPSSHVPSCQAALAKDSDSLLLLLSGYLRFAEHTSPKVPRMLM